MSDLKHSEEHREPGLLKAEDFDVDIRACSAMDCTGLIPGVVHSKAEQESYENLYPYLTKAKVKKEPENRHE